MSVEGPVTATEAPVDPEEARALAYRYLGQEFGDLYLAATAETAADNCVIRMAPESWSTADFAKEYRLTASDTCQSSRSRLAPRPTLLPAARDASRDASRSASRAAMA